VRLRWIFIYSWTDSSIYPILLALRVECGADGHFGIVWICMWTMDSQSVLESVGGDQDRAIDLLLGMNDPDFRSEAMPPTQQPQMVRQ